MPTHCGYILAASFPAVGQKQVLGTRLLFVGNTNALTDKHNERTIWCGGGLYIDRDYI